MYRSPEWRPRLGELGLMINAIALWNTAYLDKALNQLRAQGHPVRDEDAARLHPYWYSHLNVHGHYSFQPPEPGRTARLALRDPDLPDDE